eukprot:1159061-Pelagomonas_calceolata.AAC.3
MWRCRWSAGRGKNPAGEEQQPQLLDGVGCDCTGLSGHTELLKRLQSGGRVGVPGAAKTLRTRSGYLTRSSGQTGLSSHTM